MARQLLIGNDTAVSYSNGELADGAIDIQRKHAGGATAAIMSMTPLTASITDSDQFRIVQGTASGTPNIVSPWIYGKDIIDWSGKGYSAPVSQVSRLTWTGNATNTSNVEVTLKIINTSNGLTSPFDSKSYTIVDIGTPGTSDDQAIGRLMMSALYSDYSGTGSQSAVESEDLPWFVKSVDTDDAAGPEIEFIGWDKGETMRNGQVAEYPTTFKLVLENGKTAVTGGICTITTPTNADAGYGYGEYVYQMESDLMGINYGYYNRIQQPVAPSNVAVKTTTYDMYNIVATKDGSSSSQIHGVDNLIELTIAFDDSTASTVSAFQGVLNPYMLSAGFGNVVI